MQLALKRVEDVSASELADIKRGRRRIELFRKELERLEAVQDAKEIDVIDRLENGAAVDGAARVIVRRRQNISWLTIVARDLGQDAVVRAKDEWPVTFYKELQLEKGKAR